MSGSDDSGDPRRGQNDNAKAVGKGFWNKVRRTLGRVPFLDHRLAEYTAKLPPNHLLRGFTEKYILRRSMQGQLSDLLRRRSKRAFVAPIISWLFGDDRPDYVREALSPEALRDTGIFDPNAIEAAFTRLSGRPGYPTLGASWALSLALGVQVFCKEFGVRP